MPSHVSTIARALAKQRAKQNQEEGRTRVVEPPKWSSMLNGTTHFMPSFATVAFKSEEEQQLLKKSAFPDEMTCIEETEEKKSHSFH